MINDYRVAVNMEWTSKCNALCSMCPRESMARGTNMSEQTFDRALEAINPRDVSRCVIAGYGEPTTHPGFEAFLERLDRHPVRFDMATNGQLLSPDRLMQIDGKLGLLLISFSSIVPEAYAQVHRLLDYEKVVENILHAKQILKRTRLGISISPVREAIDTIDETVTWFRRHEIDTLTMSPTVYNRGGAAPESDVTPAMLRRLIKTHRLHSQELDFVTGVRDFLGQWLNNRLPCPARNSDIFISADGDYLYCFNDINHITRLGNVRDAGVREILEQRERTDQCEALCSNCNLADRYNAGEILQVALKYAGNQLGFS